MTVGPWKPIYLHAYTTYLSDFRIKQTVSESLQNVNLQIDLALTHSATPAKAKLILTHPTNPELSPAPLAIKVLDDGTVSVRYHPDEVDLWYPVGYGAQPLYELTVVVTSEDGTQVFDKQSKRIGFRRARVVEEPLKDQEGRSFFFEVNGIRIFCGGSNWYVLCLTS